MLRVIRNSDPREKPPYGAVLDPYHPLTQGLVGCWLFNEGGGNTAYNLAYVDKATLTNGPIWTPDGGVKTDDATNYIRILDPESRYSVNEFTVEMEFVINSYSQYDKLLNHKQDLAYNASEGWYIEIVDGDTLAIRDSSDGAQFGYNLGVGNVSVLVLVYASGVVHLYKDGMLSSSGSLDVVNQSTKAFDIAYREIDDGYYTGLIIYRLRFWNRVLTDGEILQAYEEPYGNLLTPYRVFCSVAGMKTPSIGG